MTRTGRLQGEDGDTAALDQGGSSTLSSDKVGAALDEALTSLQEAVDLGDRLISFPVNVDGVSTGTRPLAAGGASTAGVEQAAGEAMLRLAMLCERLALGDGAVKAGSGGQAGRRKELAALSVEHYLRAMAVG